MEKIVNKIGIAAVLAFGLTLVFNAFFVSRVNGAYTPFGINNPYMEDKQGNLPKETSDLLKDLGITWVSDNISRRDIETREYAYNWSSFDNKIKEYAKEAGLNILFVISPISNFQYTDGRLFNKSYLPQGEISFDAYKQYVEKLVTRGKGIVDMWMVFNEPRDEYRNNISDYVQLVGETYYLIKSIDPAAEVAIGGVGGSEKIGVLEKIIKELNKQYPEIVSDLWFDYHTYSWDWRDYNVKNVIHPNINGKPNTLCEVAFTKTHNDFVAMLRRVGWSEEQIATHVINKEGATHTGEFLDKSQPYWCYPNQTEFQQAEFLFKRAIDQANNKVRMIQWSTLGEKEIYYENPDSRFTQIGLIYDDSGIKKLAYYTYKLLIDELKDSDFDSVNIIETFIPNVYLYEFNKKDEAVYVAWWDYWAEGETGNAKDVAIILPNINAKQVLITEGIPDFPYDFQTPKKKLNEKEYSGFFRSYSKLIQGNNLIVTLGKAPVYIEESSISITYPRDQEVFAPGSRVTINVFSRNLGNVDNVSFYINGKRYEGRRNRQTGQYYYRWQVPWDFSQEYNIQVKVLDKKRDVIIESDVVTVFTNSLPSIHLTTEDEKNGIMTIQAQFSDNTEIVKVIFYIQDAAGKYKNARAVFRDNPKGFYTWNWRLPQKSYGVYKIWARGYIKKYGVVIDSSTIEVYE